MSTAEDLAAQDAFSFGVLEKWINVGSLHSEIPVATALLTFLSWQDDMEPPDVDLATDWEQISAHLIRSAAADICRELEGFGLTVGPLAAHLDTLTVDLQRELSLSAQQSEALYNTMVALAPVD